MKDPNATETADIVVIGAGLSGVGAAKYLSSDFPDKKVLLLEAATRSVHVDLFKYPGIRSDDSVITYGYDFKPWLHEAVLAEGA